MPDQLNISWSLSHITLAQRQKVTGQLGCVVWLTGLSGSGKSTIARALEAELIHRGRLAYVLDGDNIRHGLNANLEFSPTDRHENIRRIGEVAALFADAGVIAITAFISPYHADRQTAREAVTRLVAAGRFIEVYVNASMATCESRDPKGLYAKARAGEISEFTGIDAPYEAPPNAQINLDTASQSVASCTGQIIDYLERHGLIPLIGPRDADSAHP